MPTFYYNCFILSLSTYTHTQKQTCHLQQNLKTFLPKPIKTIERYPLTSVRMAIVKKSTNNKYWKEREQKEASYTAGGNANWCSRDRKQSGGYSEI